MDLVTAVAKADVADAHAVVGPEDPRIARGCGRRRCSGELSAAEDGSIRFRHDHPPHSNIMGRCSE